MTWKDTCRPIIAQVIADCTGKSDQEIRKALKEAYPFGTKKYSVYKIWLSEIAAQLRKKRIKESRRGNKETNTSSSLYTKEG